MRLLNARTLEFCEFYQEDAMPEYAILSHTWGTDEVLFKDWTKNRSAARKKDGFKKIRYCTMQTLKDGLDYCWVDSCCIDKRSSAELSEAINSMFRWYRKAKVCYAYLADVPQVEFQDSRWFARGWTLQEMIAPRILEFYSSDWSSLGDKVSLSNHLETITRVPTSVLIHGNFKSCCIAQRMSWAANRVTTRVEDLAYCLMGIFDINMTMLYGEGTKAFMRLQEEIIRTSDDMSIFAWRDPQATFSQYRGLLAHSPSEFSQCQTMQLRSRKDRVPYQLTNLGISLDLDILASDRVNDSAVSLKGVGYWDDAAMKFQDVGIYVQRVGTNQFARVQLDKFAPTREKRERAHCFFRQVTLMEEPNHSRVDHVLFLFTPYFTPETLWSVHTVSPASLWDHTSSILRFPDPQQGGTLEPVAFTLENKSNGSMVTILFDITKEWGNLMTCKEDGWNLTRHMESTYPTIYSVRIEKPPHRGIYIDVQGDLTSKGISKIEMRML